MLNLAGSSNQKQLTQFRHGPDLTNPTQVALADKSALPFHIEEQQSTSKKSKLYCTYT